MMEVVTMDEFLTIETTPEEMAQLQQAIDDIFHKMEQADQRFQQAQKEIDRLKIETQAVLRNLKVTA
jgi:hypothetical protein